MSPCVTPTHDAPLQLPIVSLITVTSDSDHSDESDVTPRVAPVSPSVYGTPLTSPRAPGVPGDSEGEGEHFTYNANKPWPGTSGQCHQPSHAVSTQARAHGGEMGLPSQNLIQQQQSESNCELTSSGRSRSEDGERAGGRLRSPAQSC